MNDKAIFASDVVENNGKTVRENNLEQTHRFAPLTPVVIKKEDGKVPYFMEHDCQHIQYMVENGLPFYIVSCERDCDGTVLYTLAITPIDLEGQDPFDYAQSLVPEQIAFESLDNFLQVATRFMDYLFVRHLSEEAIEQYQSQ